MEVKFPDTGRAGAEARLTAEEVAWVESLVQYGTFSRFHVSRGWSPEEVRRVQERATRMGLVRRNATGDYEEALRWFHRMSDYASAAGDKFWIARAPNIIGGVHLELYDVDEAIAFGLEGDEVSQKMFSWSEPRGHSLLKVGLAHLARGDHGLAEEFLRRAWALLEGDVWYRWRWHIPLLRARGELALAEGRHDDAWSHAAQFLEMAQQSDSRKHAARARRLQGEILGARGQLDAAAEALRASIALAETIKTPREVWLGKAALGGVLAQVGRDQDAEAQLVGAARTIEAIAEKLATPSLRRSFLCAEPVLAVYRALGHRRPGP